MSGDGRGRGNGFPAFLMEFLCEATAVTRVSVFGCIWRKFATDFDRDLQKTTWLRFWPLIVLIDDHFNVFPPILPCLFPCFCPCSFPGPCYVYWCAREVRGDRLRNAVHHPDAQQGICHRKSWTTAPEAGLDSGVSWRTWGCWDAGAGMHLAKWLGTSRNHW